MANTKRNELEVRIEEQAKMIENQALKLEEQATELRILKMVLDCIKEMEFDERKKKCENCEACICGTYRPRKDRSGQAAGDRYSTGTAWGA